MKAGMVDLDGTVSNWLGWVTKELGRSPNYAKAPRLETMYGVTKSKAQELLMNPEGYSSNSVRAIPLAVITLRKLLMGGYQLFYVSAAPIEFQTQRLFWMVRKGFPIDKSNREKATLTHMGSSEAKEAWLREHADQLDFIVDDLEGILNVAEKAGVPYRFLLSTKYNLEHSGRHIRVRSWKEIGDILL